MYNLFNEKEPPVFPGTFSYNAAAASNSEHNQIKTVGKHKTNINRNRQKHHQNNQVQPVNKATDQQIKPAISHRPAASKTLLIGTSFLAGINRKGLNKNIECNPIPGATVDILIDKIQIFDLKCFSSIVI